MNIFVTDSDPEICAKALDDKRVIKMILESAQLLSTAMHAHQIENAPYRVTHLNHPCAIFTGQTRGNFRWVLKHFIALCKEYKIRYGKIHHCFDFTPIFKSAATKIPFGKLTAFVNCTPHKEMENVYEAYRKTLSEKWINDKRTPTWRCDRKPNWYH